MNSVITKRSASTIMRRIRGACWARTRQRCVDTRRLISAQRGNSVQRPTTVLNHSIIPRNTRPSFARNRRKPVTLAICALLLTVRMSYLSICCIAWSKTQTSICFISKRFGVRSMTSRRVTCAMSASTRTIGRTSGVNRTCMSIRPRNSAASGALRRRREPIVMVVTWSIAA